MAQQDRKNESTREAGADVANVGTGRERAIVGRSERRVDASTRPGEELAHEVAGRGSATDAHQGNVQGRKPDAPAEEQLSGYGNREDRENPGLGLQQSGENQSHELPGQGTRVGNDEKKDTRATKTRDPVDSRAMSQNGARISDFEERPSR